jgi:DNA-binding GntR family transcriptional regulator
MEDCQLTVSRRHVIVGIASALASGATAPAFAGASDAELRALEQAFDAARAAWLASDPLDSDLEGRAMDQALTDALYAIVDRIIAAPASTPAGLRIKLRIWGWECEGGNELAEPRDKGFFQSVCQDVDAMAETA